MVLPQLTSADRPVEQPHRYIGEERRQFAGTRQSSSSAKVRLTGLALVAIAATALHWQLDGIEGAPMHAIAAGLLGLPVAATFLYAFRFGLLRDTFSLTIGTVAVTTSVALGVLQAGLVDRSWGASALASLVAAAVGCLSVTLRHAVIDTQLHAVRRVCAVVSAMLVAAAVGTAADQFVRRSWGPRAATWLAVGVASIALAHLTSVARSALRRHRAVVTATVACLYLVPLASMLLLVGDGGTASLGVSLLYLTTTLVVLEASVDELRSAFAHEQRRIIDLFVLSHEQQQVLDAERTASATRRHDQKASVIAIEGAISALAGETHTSLPNDTRDHLTTAVKAELARLRRGLERTSPPDVSLVALREVLNPLVVCMRSEGVNVRLAVPTGMVVETHCDTLLEIVQNLIDNAAIHGGNRSIVVRARPTDHGFDLEVSDRGPGVPEALRDVIFDRGVTSRAADHSGLGLFSAKELARRIGADLGVEPGRRGGARFVLRVASAEGGRDVS
jgi:signal transduction histidine kinase